MRRDRLEIARRSDDGGHLPPVVGTFLRGLSVGALVGAAIAGSALLQRRRRTIDEQRNAADRET